MSTMSKINNFLRTDADAMLYAVDVKQLEDGIEATCRVRHGNGQVGFSGKGADLEQAMNDMIDRVLHSERNLLATLRVNEPVTLIDEDSSAVMRVARKLKALD